MLNTFSQTIEKLYVSYEYADLYVDTTLLATIKTHTNFDFVNSTYYMFWSTTSERLYHFIYPESACYDLNRISFTYDLATETYKNDFPIFKESVKIKFTQNFKELKLIKDKFYIIFYNE
ncbi:MAG: hypothetical protein HPY57_14230 [Ignavibacteria bacterium]|nr:hypothetical protein [Ignavibacteria bacterium]